MNAVEFLFLVQKSESLHVPGDVSGIRHDLEVFMGAISPFFCSSKSLVSANGNAALACLSTSCVYFDGALPFGWKCPCRGADG